MSEPFLGEIRPFAFGFVPRGWAACAGQMMSIQQNSALFAILGTTYGGNGQTTFGLPDLRNRVPVHRGNGPGLPPVQLGEPGGAESVQLQASQMPQHQHGTQASADLAVDNTASGEVMGAKGRGSADAFGPGSSLVALQAGSVSAAGGSQPHPNVQPTLAIQFCIALQGIFPSRN